MVAKPSFRCFGSGQPIISEIGNLVHHDHLYQVLPEFLKRLKYSQSVTESILSRAEDLEQQGLKPIDALHLACAEAARVDCFLTCDDRVIRRYSGAPMKVLNPVDFIMAVTGG